MTIFERFLNGEIRALSRIVSFVENREAGYRELLAKLYSRTGGSLRIGITGPPGAGKSSLVDLLAHRYLEQGKAVGVIAVDPTSPFTGGALLGDRVRLSTYAGNNRFFFRSMATRGATGGLAGATDNVAIVYDAFGFDVTLIETVGVGQVELDIINSCDVVVVVLVPESGDSVQTMKAGLMEIAHVFCINKADRPGAERIASELRHALDTRKQTAATWRPPIVMTVAIQKKGIDELYRAIHGYVEVAQGDGRIEAQRRERLKRKVFRILTNRFQREFAEKMAANGELSATLERIANGEANPFTVGDELYARFTRQ